MFASIITIGDEILNGQTIDTNSSWISRQLEAVGIATCEKRTIADKQKNIVEALDEAKKAADIILITGGLGPTKDDITKRTLAEYFGSMLVIDQSILKDITQFFEKHGKQLTATNKLQAEVPDKCTPLRNPEGTAPGMWFEEEGKIFIAMPGVPFEMKTMMENEVIPRIKNLSSGNILHRHINTIGIGESFLADMLKDFEDQLPDSIGLAYLPSMLIVRIRLTAAGADESELQKKLDIQLGKLNNIIPEYIYGYDGDTMERIVGQLLRERKATLSTAESCTGGYIASSITSISGSSDYFQGSIVSYSNEIKQTALGVTRETLEKHGAVSEAVVREMLSGIMKNLNTDYGIAVTGIAGPEGGTEEKPVGTVWVAVGGQDRVSAKRYQLRNDRTLNIELTSIIALDTLRKLLLGQLD